MKKVQNIWAELSKAKKAPQRTKLSAKKRNVKLSKVEEAYAQYEELRDAHSELAYFVDEVLPDLEDKMSDIYRTVDEYFINGQIRYVEEIAQNLYENLQDIADSAKELGLDNSEIFDEYDDAFGLSMEAEDLLKRGKSDWESSRVSRASNFDFPA